MLQTQHGNSEVGAFDRCLKFFPAKLSLVICQFHLHLLGSAFESPTSAFFQSLSDRCSFPGLAVDRLRPLCTAPGGKCLHGCSAPRWPDLQVTRLTSDFLKTKPGETSISGLATSDKTSDQ